MQITKAGQECCNSSLLPVFSHLWLKLFLYRETAPAGLTTLVKFSLNHFSDHFNFWDECKYKLQETTFFFFLYLKKLGSLQDLCICITRNYNKLFSLHVYATYDFTNFLYIHVSFFSPSGNKKQSLLHHLWKTHFQSSLSTTASRRQQRAKQHMEHMVSL